MRKVLASLFFSLMVVAIMGNRSCVPVEPEEPACLDDGFVCTADSECCGGLCWNNPGDPFAIYGECRSTNDGWCNTDADCPDGQFCTGEGYCLGDFGPCQVEGLEACVPGENKHFDSCVAARSGELRLVRSHCGRENTCVFTSQSTVACEPVSDLEGVPCADDADCAGSLFCDHGVCSMPCTNEYDCQEGQLCYSWTNTCQWPNSGEFCNVSSDCPNYSGDSNQWPHGGQICYQGHCDYYIFGPCEVESQMLCAPEDGPAEFYRCVVEDGTEVLHWIRGTCGAAYECVKNSDGNGQCIAPQPAESSVQVSRLMSQSQLYYGENQMFVFRLMIVALDGFVGEHGVLNELSFSIQMSERDYSRIHYCKVVEYQTGYMLDYSDNLELRTSETGSQYALVNFHFEGDVLLPVGAYTNLELRCFVASGGAPYEAIQTGFIGRLGTSPADAIVVYGVESGERLSVSPTYSEDTLVSILTR